MPVPGSLPRVAAPEWHGGASSAPPAKPARPNPAAAPGGSNWLVDAMLKPGAEPEGERVRSRRGATGEFETATASSSRPEGRGVLADSPEPRDRTATASQPPDAGTVINPLAGFLGEWMSPQDLALLKPGLSGIPAVPITRPLSGSPFGPTSGGMSAPGAESGGGMSPPGMLISRGLGTARENPFLQGLNPPVPSIPPVAVPPKTVQSAPAAGPATSVPMSPPPPAGPSRTPEFARPTSDDRYFKPLKRF